MLALATLVALVATAGSLFFSQVLGLIPCELCWYQRILMYPLVVVLGVAAVEERANVARTVLPLSTLGIAVATYHSFLQTTTNQSTCAVGACGSVQYRILGLTIPNLSLVAFVLVTVAVGLVWYASR
ncbi:disulfide bond formation protein B [Haloarculaceae archaeon H-GB2-1]|nr:disulfide bond formation protein B [Haloarculaceae archaeon H-GB1-1]MEA5409260.1 disulfide bond formation protein B [Haloarculaceae archaeon H-GB2-1]